MYFDIHTHQSTCPDATCIQNIIVKENTIINIEENQYYSAGIHPWYLPENMNISLTLLENTIQHKQVLAIGEIGLDFHPDILQKHSKQEQIIVFIKQIQLAEKYHKPIIIHCVKAWDTLLDLKKNYGKNIPWIVHGFNKNKFLATQLVKADFYLSFGAHIFKSTTNAEALKNIPLDKVLLETDAQTAYPIQNIYQKASEILDVSAQIIITAINKKIDILFK